MGCAGMRLGRKYPAYRNKNTHWWGIMGEKLYKMMSRISPSETVSGIPGSATDQHGVPFSLTEEFVSVYRLHPLLPDHVAFFDVQTGEHRTGAGSQRGLRR